MPASCGTGIECLRHFVARSWLLPTDSTPNVAPMPDRPVRFTEQFFDRLDSILPQERGDDGEPSATDFLLFDLPRIRDLLASDFEANTFPIEDSDLRAFVGAGMLVPSIVLYACSDDVAVVVTWIAIGNESFDDDTGHAH